MEWQPMAIAPKDGTMILLVQETETGSWNAYAGPFLGWWQGGKYPWAFIDSAEDGAKCEECSFENDGVVVLNGFSESHPPAMWMPLPAPPVKP
jgi:hypothetical protein